MSDYQLIQFDGHTVAVIAPEDLEQLEAEIAKLRQQTMPIDPHTDLPKADEIAWLWDRGIKQWIRWTLGHTVNPDKLVALGFGPWLHMPPAPENA